MRLRLVYLDAELIRRVQTKPKADGAPKKVKAVKEEEPPFVSTTKPGEKKGPSGLSTGDAS